METQTCSKCHEIKPLNEDFFEFRKENQTFRGVCRECNNKRARENEERLKIENPKLYEKRKKRQRKQINKWAKNNPEKIKENQNKFRKSEKFQEWKVSFFTDEKKEEISAQKKEYTSRDPERWQKYQASYYQDNKERIKIRNEENKEHRKEVRREYMRKKRKSPGERLRNNISRKISLIIKSKGKYKNNESFLDYVDWTIDELFVWLETQFEPWMTRENYGRYERKTWDDNDPTTWKWQIDHIIPLSDLPFDNMDHPNFKKAWALENLRPLSAKQNLLDGVSRVRHVKKTT